MNPSKILFVGHGNSAVAWYRCFLPAQALDADHVGIGGEPPNERWVTGLVRKPGEQQKQSVMPDFTAYEMVVLQQPFGRGWFRRIQELKRAGVKVVFEVDDYLHGIRKQEDHDFREAFGKDKLKEYELCMRGSDAVICSTEYIARRYRRFNPRTFVCENGLDLKRYELTRPERETVNIGWSGATGHTKSMRPWLDAVAAVMRERDDTCFVTIGQPFADELRREFGNRCLSVPFCAVEQYPAAMTMMDIALGPARHTQFYAGKSDLRWLEAGALGAPIVADPFVYGKIRDGYDGFHAETTEQIAEVLFDLVSDPNLRTGVGGNARRYVREERDINVVARDWMEVFDAIA